MRSVFSAFLFRQATTASRYLADFFNSSSPEHDLAEGESESFAEGESESFAEGESESFAYLSGCGVKVRRLAKLGEEKK